MKIAVIGSRVHPPEVLTRVEEHVQSTLGGAILVSGGAKGTDQAAEGAHAGRVFSFRLYSENDHYGVEFWDYGGDDPKTVRFDCFFADAKSALLYRDFLIAHECDELHAFWNGWSTGTEFTAKLAKDLGKEVKYL